MCITDETVYNFNNVDFIDKDVMVLPKPRLCFFYACVISIVNKTI